MLSFRSFCGGLPCPDDNNNPFGYKFSWSPRGVLLAAIREAFYIEDGERKTMSAAPGQGIYENYKLDSSVPNCGPPLEKAAWPAAFESHPNGDSAKFQAIYGIPECRTLIRGTYRTKGWCDTMQKIKELGLLDETPCAAELEAVRPPPAARAGRRGSPAPRPRLPTSWPRLWVGRRQTPRRAPPPSSSLPRTIPSSPGSSGSGFLATSPPQCVPPPGHARADRRSHPLRRPPSSTLCAPSSRATPSSGMGARPARSPPGGPLTPGARYAEGERDMIAMHHAFEVERADGKAEKITSTLIDYGVKNGDTSMARTVTLPIVRPPSASPHTGLAQRTRPAGHRNQAHPQRRHHRHRRGAPHHPRPVQPNPGRDGLSRVHLYREDGPHVAPHTTAPPAASPPRRAAQSRAESRC